MIGIEMVFCLAALTAAQSPYSIGDDAERLVWSWPANPSFYVRRGIDYAAKKDSDNAIRDFSEAISIHLMYGNSDYATFGYSYRCPQAYFFRGIAYLGRKKYHLGIEDLKDYWRVSIDDFKSVKPLTDAIRLDPKNPQRFIDRGKLFMKMGYYDQAVEDFSQAIRMNPKNAFAFARRADAYMAKGEHEKAKKDSSEADRLDPARRKRSNWEIDPVILKLLEQGYHVPSLAPDGPLPWKYGIDPEIFRSLGEDP